MKTPSVKRNFAILGTLPGLVIPSLQAHGRAEGREEPRLGREHLHHLLEPVGRWSLCASTVSKMTSTRSAIHTQVEEYLSDALFATRQHPWCDDERDEAEPVRRHGHGWTVGHEKRGETLAGQQWKTRGGIAVSQPLLLTLHSHEELVRTGLWLHVKVNALPPRGPPHHGPSPYLY